MSASHASISPLLVGRDDLVELVDRRLDEVSSGRGQFLLLTGEAGIGKSRMVAAIQRAARSRGFEALEGDIAPQDHDVPAALIFDLARTAAGTKGFAGLGGDLLALRDAVDTTGQARRRRLVVDVVALVGATLTVPTLIVFEDLQWSDELSLEIIAELARTTRDRPLLLVATYRSGESPPGTALRDWRSRLVTQRIAEEVRLGPLDLAQTALVTTLILDTGLPAPREVVAAVFERTDGVPLHIEELLGAMSAQARADGRAIREARVPETIEDAVLERLDRRSPEAQRVARAGAVVGRCFVPDVLAGIMDARPDELDGPIQELIDHGVLTPVGPRGMVDFRHQLLRDAIYRSVTVGDRRRYHARAAEFGATLEGHSEIHASAHYERAGLRRPAFEAALAGAQAAAELSAHREAFELYRRAVDNMPDDTPAAERSAIFDAFGAEAMAVEENALAERMFEAAHEIDVAIGDVAHAAWQTFGITNVWRRDLRPLAERQALLERALAETDALPAGRERDDARGALLIDLVICQLDAGDAAHARQSLADCAETYRRLGDGAGQIFAESLLGLVEILDGRIVGGLSRVAAAAAAGQDAGEESEGVTAYRNATVWAVRTLHYDLAQTYLAEGLRYADSIEQSHCAHVMQASAAMVAWAGADWVGATTQARQAVADHGCHRAATMARWSLGYVALGTGDVARAERELTLALEAGEMHGSLDMILPPLWGLAEAALLGGDPERAADLCHQALARAAVIGELALVVPFVVTGVRAEQAAGRPSAAERWLDACATYLSGLERVGEAALVHGRGLVAMADGSTGIARAALEAAVRGWDDLGRSWEAAFARLDLAACHIRSNRFADPVALAVEVRTLASRLDSLPLAERAEAIQRQARGRIVIDEPWRPLTAREYAVARLVSEGYTNAEIADSLGIAPKTASSHIEHILAKLGASRRAEIASWASSVERSPVAR